MDNPGVSLYYQIHARLKFRKSPLEQLQYLWKEVIENSWEKPFAKFGLVLSLSPFHRCISSLQFGLQCSDFSPLFLEQRDDFSNFMLLDQRGDLSDIGLQSHDLRFQYRGLIETPVLIVPILDRNVVPNLLFQIRNETSFQI